ncbi:hypothetical protein TrRE_jg10675 [Triparma retinervis]|uniref:Alpha-1,3-glucosyltransferase n=1 Tax=Triparma retinervis TaxID=2557542 RepID=A0A9W7E3E7_9STRA|nr:hypothetical protein TrRE_jg10675 [Triparma retinervis]
MVSPAFVDPACFNLLSTEDGASPSPSCVVFQRLTVNLVDLLLFVPSSIYAAHSLYNDDDVGSSSRTFSSTAVTTLLISNVGLLILDHMHFQYNAGLFSLLLLSLTVESTLASAVLYVLLITSKHLYLILGPVYVVKMFSGYCLPKRSFSLGKFLLLACTTVSAFVLPFVPLFGGEGRGSFDTLLQIKSRLFPFQRGLTHAYWAPNVWAIWAFTDKVMGKVLGGGREVDGGGSTGLVSDKQFSHLPNLGPLVPLLMTVTALLPLLPKLFKHPTKTTMIQCCACLSMSSFMLGYHVHEKAIMTPVLLSALLVFKIPEYNVMYPQFSLMAHISLCPLIPPGLGASILKYFLVFFHHILTTNLGGGARCWWGRDTVFWGGAIAVPFFGEVVHPLAFKGRMEFLPLMAFSVTGTLYNLYFWWKLHVTYFGSGIDEMVQRKKKDK